MTSLTGWAVALNGRACWHIAYPPVAGCRLGDREEGSARSLSSWPSAARWLPEALLAYYRSGDSARLGACSSTQAARDLAGS